MLKFYKLYSFFIQFNRYLRVLKQNTRHINKITNLPNKFKVMFYLKFFMIKYLEYDVKSLTFIILPITN